MYNQPTTIWFLSRVKGEVGENHTSQALILSIICTLFVLEKVSPSICPCIHLGKAQTSEVEGDQRAMQKAAITLLLGLLVVGKQRIGALAPPN